MRISNLNLKTANNTSLNIKSIAVIDFSLKPNSQMVHVPLLDINESVENPSSDHILIENLVVSKNDPAIFDTLMLVFLYIFLVNAQRLLLLSFKGLPSHPTC